MPIGRECIDHYAEMKRHCVFSNDELLCTLAELAVGRLQPLDVLRTSNLDGENGVIPGCSVAGLDISCVAIVHQEFMLLVKRERKLRELVKSKGVVNSIKMKFTDLADDSRVCDLCMTTLFLSGVSCACLQNRSSLNCLSTQRKRKLLNSESAEG